MVLTRDQDYCLILYHCVQVHPRDSPAKSGRRFRPIILISSYRRSL